jgi:hypothetical protein
VRLRATLLAALVAALVLPAAAQAQLPEAFWGVTGDGPLLSAESDIFTETRLMQETGIRSLRVDFPWAQIQPRRDGPLLLGAYDRIVLAAADRGIGVLPVVWSTPRWAARQRRGRGATPRDPRTYAAFLTALIARYGPDGSLWSEHPNVRRVPVRAWQVWNEPNHTPFWRARPWERTYLRLLRVARRAIRSADPGAQVVLAGLTHLSWEGLLRIYRAGGRGLFDAAAIHSFSRTVPNLLVVAQRARNAMRRMGDRRTPLMITEMTWTSGRGNSTINYGWETTERGQARRLYDSMRLLVRHRRRLNLQAVYWYTWLSPPIGRRWSFHYSGLRRQTRDGVVSKPALEAYARAIRTLR